MSGESSPRIAAQEFASSLKAIQFTALILFRDIGGKPPTAEWREIQLADACNHFDQCVKSIEARIADKVGTAIDSNPRKWFANTLTALKRLIDRLWLSDRLLRHADLDRLTEDEQADLERLRQEVECRAEELESAALTLPGDTVPAIDNATAEHSSDFRCVAWFGTPHEFTTNQARIVELLWREWERGVPVVSQDWIVEQLNLSGRLQDSFRGHLAWNTMIASGETKGSVRLNADPPARKL